MKSLNKEIEQELLKEKELIIEKEKLMHIIFYIQEEIIRAVASRKSIGEEIVTYRKKTLEEYRDDDDKPKDSFNHEEFIYEEAYKALHKKLGELTLLKNSPYFGRVDIKETGEYDSLYIGKFGLLDKDDMPLIVDWRAPVSSLFYNGGIGPSSYLSPNGKVNIDVLLRRQYVIKNGELKGMFDSSLDVKDEILQEVLCSSSSDKLKDIVMTIQKEQDEIIRKEKNTSVIINGVAGSGKTTIALHRVAYLLYNNREYFKDKVLILGPNNIFMDYIKEVLPALGEEGVAQKTYLDFAANLCHIDEYMSLREYMEKILNGEEEFIKKVEYKTSVPYIFELDALVVEMDNKYFTPKDLYYGDKICVPASAIMDLYTYYKNMPMKKRLKKVKRILFRKLKDVRDEEVREINNWYKLQEEKLNSEGKNNTLNNLLFQKKAKIRDEVLKVYMAKKTMSFLNSPDIVELYKVFSKETYLNVDDLSAILYLKVKLEGFKLGREYKHVVIDEAQDFSVLSFILIKMLTGCTSMTISGDENQRLIPLKDKLPMLEIPTFLKELKIENFNLRKSYRSTKEIMEYANSLILEEREVPFVRSGSPVECYNLEFKEALEKIRDIIREFKAKNCNSIGIICKDMEESKRVSEELKKLEHIIFLNNEDVIYNKGVVVAPSYFSKGMEFDGVVAVNFGETTTALHKLNYVIATRAIHNLSVVNITS